jgi:HJR/Mrr/RecB family endonuclease
VHELAYKRISTVSYQRGLLSSSLTLHARELTLTVRLRNKSEWSTIDRIVSAVKAGIVFSPLAQASGPAGPPASSTRSQGDGLEALDPLAFEELIRQLLEAMGYQARLTQRSHDGGIDVHAFDPQPIRGGAVVVQCKLYKNAVPVECVRDLYGVVHSEGATKGILITTSHFSADGHAFAKNKPLELIERRSLEALLQQYGLMDQERSGAWGWPGQGGL